MTPSPATPTAVPAILPTHSQIPLPEAWQPVVEAQLVKEEKVVAWLEIDLNASLHFGKGLIVLTDRRLLARTGDSPEWQSHPLREGLRLMRRDHAGVGSLELVDASGRHAHRRPDGADRLGNRPYQHLHLAAFP